MSKKLPPGVLSISTPKLAHCALCLSHSHPSIRALLTFSCMEASEAIHLKKNQAIRGQLLLTNQNLTLCPCSFPLPPWRWLLQVVSHLHSLRLKQKVSLVLWQPGLSTFSSSTLDSRVKRISSPLGRGKSTQLPMSSSRSPGCPAQVKPSMPIMSNPILLALLAAVSISLS